MSTATWPCSPIPSIMLWDYVIGKNDLFVAHVVVVNYVYVNALTIPV